MSLYNGLIADLDVLVNNRIAEIRVLTDSNDPKKAEKIAALGSIIDEFTKFKETAGKLNQRWVTR